MNMHSSSILWAIAISFLGCAAILFGLWVVGKFVFWLSKTVFGYEISNIEVILILSIACLSIAVRISDYFT